MNITPLSGQIDCKSDQSSSFTHYHVVSNHVYDFLSSMENKRELEDRSHFEHFYGSSNCLAIQNFTFCVPKKKVIQICNDVRDK